MSPNFSHWLNELIKSADAKGKAKSKPRRLECEQLEDRVVPATLISIVTGVAGTGTLDAFLSATDGTINATDSAGFAGSISQGALQTVGAGIQVSITAETSITFSAGLTTPIALLTNNTSSAQFIALNGNVTFADTTDSLSTSGGALALISTNGSLTTGNLASANGAIDLFADTVAVVGTVNAGNSASGGIVTIRQVTDGTDIDIGTETVGELSLTQAELSQVTARILRIGTSNSGQVTISTGITLGANVPALSLISGEDITQAGAAAVTVANLRVSATDSVRLDDANNDIDSFAGAVTAVNSFFEFLDADGFVIDTVDGVAGLSTSTASLNSNLSLTAGGAVTQTSGANVVTAELELLGAGSYTLTNVGNDAQELGANIGGALSYTDANALVITQAENTSGITTSNDPVAIDTVNGALTVLDTLAGADVNAGSGTVSLTAGDPNGVDHDLIISANADVIGTGGVTLVGDNINIGAAVDAGTNTATIRQFANGTLIDLGGADGANTLGLTDAELDFVTAGIIRIGDANAGNISITAAIAPANTSQLELVTGAAILDGGGSITETRLGLTAGTNIGAAAAGNQIETTVSNLEAVTNTNGIFINNTGTSLTIGGVNATLSGVRTLVSNSITITNNNNITISEGISIGGVTGSITVTTSSGSINVNAAVTNSGPGNVNITAEDNVDVTAAVSTQGAGSISIIAEPFVGVSAVAGSFNSSGAGTVTSADGDINIQAGDSVTVGAAVASTGAGAILITADVAIDSIGSFSNSAAGTLSTQGGAITVGGTPANSPVNANVNGAITVTGGTGAVTITAQGNIAVTAAVTVTGTGAITVGADDDNSGAGFFSNTAAGDLSTAGGDITITAQEIDIAGFIGTGVGAATRIVTLTTRTAADVISIGSESATQTDFFLSDTELDLVNAAVLRVGTGVTAGDILITGQITLLPANVPVLSLETTGAIQENTAGEQTDITVRDLALRAGTGIGSVSDLNLAVNNLASINSISGSSVVVNTGALTLARNIDGLSGVTNNGVGITLVAAFNGGLTIDSTVLAAGGGSIFLITGGTNGDIAKTVEGTIDTTGGNGNITVDSSAATTGGDITIASNPFDFDIDASGSGAVNIFAAGAISVAGGAVIESDTGAVTLEANSDNAGVANINRTGDITFGAGTRVRTDGVIDINADPDANCVGGQIIMTPTTVIGGKSGAAALSISLRAAGDITLSSLTATTTIFVHSCQNIVDDAVETTFLSANQITLDSDGRIGGQNIIQVADVLSAATTPTLVFREAIDFDLTGANPNLTIIQSPAGGNVQLRKVNSGLTVNAGTLNIAGAVVGPVNQFALISSGGNLALNTLLAPPTNLDTLLATTGGFDLVFGAAGQLVNGTATATTTVVASGSTAADISGPANDNNPQISGSTTRLHTTGGNIGTVGASLEINANRLDGFTNGNAAAGGNSFITDVANGVAIGQFNAGAGNFTLHSIGNTGVSTNITAVTANDGIAEVIGNVVTLDVTNPATAATAPPTGNTGQIGSFAGVGQFFEVSATVLNAATNNSRLWIAEVGTGINAGADIGLVTAGTNTAFLRVTNGGTLRSQTVDGVADVIGSTVNLSTLAGDSGSFGTNTGSPLEIDAATLNANLLGTSGNIFVYDTAGGLAVQRASTTGNVGLETFGGDLVLGNASSTGSAVTATGGTATLKSSGTIDSSAPGGVVDVTATSLAATATGGGIGAGTALETVVSTFASSATGNTSIDNTGNLVLGAVSGVVGVTVTGGTVTVTTTGSLIVANTVAGNTVNLTTTDAVTAGQDLTVNNGVNITASAASVGLFAGDNLTVNGAVSGNLQIVLQVDSGNADIGGGTFTLGATGTLTSPNTVIYGSSEADTFNLRPQAIGSDIAVVGFAPSTLPGDVLNLDLAGATGATLTPTSSENGVFNFANRAGVQFVAIESVVISNGTVELIIDMAALGLQNGSANPDVTALSTTAGGVLNATVQDNSAGAPQTVFSGLASTVHTITVIGSTDRDNVRIDLTNAGLPAIDVSGGAPAIAPGDRLEINFTNATGTTFTPGAPGAGTYTFANRAAIAFDEIEVLPASLVTIAATDPTAAELAPFQIPNSGLFTLTRVGDLSVALSVSYSVGGTAANGQDYQPITGTVTFAINSATATIVVDAKNDSLIEGTQSVTLALTAGTGYTFQPGAAATVNILDNDRVTTGYVASSGNGTLADIRVYGPADPQNPRLQFTPFGNYFGGVVVATGDVNGDGIADIGVAVASGGNPHVKVFNGIDGSEIASFFAFDTAYLGGVTLAIADLNGDGLAEIIVGAAEGVSHVKVFSGDGFAELGSFFAYTDANNAPTPSGVNVSAGDFDGDGRSEIVTGARSIAPHVKVFTGTGAEVNSFIASFAGIAYTGGITVTAGDLDGDGRAELAAGITANGQSLVNVYYGNGEIRGPIAVPNARGTAPGISISDFNGNGGRELIITTGPQVNFFDGVSLGFIGAIQPYTNYAGDIFVGA